MGSVITNALRLVIDGVEHVLYRGRLMPAVAGGEPTVEEHEARLTEIRSRITELDQQYAGATMPEEARGEWNTLLTERQSTMSLIDELRRRAEVVEGLSGDTDNTETIDSFRTRAPERHNGDIWDVAAVRMAARGPVEESRMLRDNALKAVEQAQFPHPEARQDDVKTHIDRLMERFGNDDMQDQSDRSGAAVQEFARRILQTGSPTYKRAFAKLVTGRPINADEQRALSLTGNAGGYAVPFTLDPTIIPTSNSTVNPMRAIARTETISGSDTWKGVSSGAIVASRDGEAAEVSDDTPTLAQPVAKVNKVQTFVPFSVEIEGDWGSMASEMAVLIQDAKDDEEADSFVIGSGDGSTGPQGVVTAAGTLPAGTAAFAVGHLYSLEEGLAPRFRPRGHFIGNRSQYNRIRQFDTAGGASLWVQNLTQGLNNGVPTPGNLGATLLGYPAHEASKMASVLTAASKILLFGDFRYYLIVDRIGMNVEIVPHLFGASFRPTGQRGIYAYWRNTGVALAAGAFKVLQTT